jgi:hypothetical protein
MRILSSITSAIASFFSFLKNRDAVATKKNANAIHVSSYIRIDEKKIATTRKREFDKLRSLLQNEVVDEDLPEQRFFRTSMLTDLSEKTSTLHKIDAIESQMSVQWLKTERLDLNGGGNRPIPLSGSLPNPLPNPLPNIPSNNLQIVLE